MTFERVRGPASDRYDCFNIRDFRKNDSIIVLVERGKRRLRGVVTYVDEETNMISFVTNEGDYMTDINSIVFLGEPKGGWLERADS